MPTKKKYPSTELSTGQRELIASLVGPLEERGISRSAFRDILAAAKITVPKSSLDRWVYAHVSNVSIFTTEKGSGSPPLLDDDQREIAAGWVLFQNDSNQMVSIASFSNFCATAFGVTLSQGTAHNYLHALGLSSKVSQVKNNGFTVDIDTLSKMMFDWKCCYVPRKSQLVIPRFAGSKFARCPTQRYYMGQDPMPKSDGLNVQQNKRRQD